MKTLKKLSLTWVLIISAATLDLILCLAGLSAFIDRGLDISSGTCITAGLFIGFVVAAFLVYIMASQNLTDLQMELAECNSAMQKLRNELELKEGQRAYAAEELVKAFSDLEDKEMKLSVMAKRISTLDQDKEKLHQYIDHLIKNYKKVWCDLDRIKRLSTDYTEKYSKQLRTLEDWKAQARKIIRILRKDNHILKARLDEYLMLKEVS